MSAATAAAPTSSRRALTATASPSRQAARDVGAQAAELPVTRATRAGMSRTGRRRPAGGGAGREPVADLVHPREVEVGDGQPLAVRRLRQDDPQGSMIMLRPWVSVPSSWRPCWPAATTKAWFSMARALRSGSQWSRPVTAVKAAGTTMISAPPSARRR